MNRAVLIALSMGVLFGAGGYAVAGLSGQPESQLPECARSTQSIESQIAQERAAAKALKDDVARLGAQVTLLSRIMEDKQRRGRREITSE